MGCHSHTSLPIRVPSMTADRLLELAAAGHLYAGVGRPASAVVATLDGDDLLFVRWALAGQVTGHEWHACGKCGQLRLMKIQLRRRCTLSVRCGGHMERIVARPRLTAAVKQALRG